MKKILLILSSELSLYQMLTHLKQSKEKCIFDLLVEDDNKNFNKNNKIFKSISKNSFFIKKFPRPIFFNFFKFWNIFFAYKNRIVIKKIHNLLKKNYFNLKDYDEVYFSNEAISNYILHGSNIKKIYFDHSPIDVLLNTRLNFIKNLNNFLLSFINNKIMNIYYKGNNNFFQKSIFANFLKKNNSEYSLPIKIFKNIFFKYNKKTVKKIPNTDYNLINFYCPYYAFNRKYSGVILKNYINFFINNILNRILLVASANDVFLFKFKQNIPIKFQSYVINLFKKKFPGKKFVLVNKDFPKMVNLEKIIYNFNIKRHFTLYSSSIFFAKILNSQISIYDYGPLWSGFVKKNWKFFKNKNNFNNNLLASKLYRNFTNKL